MNINIKLPPVFKDLFNDQYRYYVYYSGRGSGKSWSIARLLIIKALQEKCRILCCRELMNSIKESVHSLFIKQIELLGLSNYFKINTNNIISHIGSEIFYTGLHHNLESIKSDENIKYCWIEEASSVSEESLQVLFPTIRLQDSKIYVSFNPEYEEDPIYQRFIVKKQSNALVKFTNWRDNNHLSKTANQERLNDKENLDLEDYEWIWEGKLRPHKESIIYKHFDHDNYINDFDRSYNKIFFGVDWGFAHPFALVVRMITPKYHVTIDTFRQSLLNTVEQVQVIKQYNDFYHPESIYCDSANPESIAVAEKVNLPVKGVIKGKDSVETGIGLHQALIKSKTYRILPDRCEELIKEYKNYCWLPNGKPSNINDDLLACERYITKSTMGIQSELRKRKGFRELDFDPFKHIFYSYFNDPKHRQHKDRAMRELQVNEWGDKVENKGVDYKNLGSLGQFLPRGNRRF